MVSEVSETSDWADPQQRVPVEVWDPSYRRGPMVLRAVALAFLALVLAVPGGLLALTGRAVVGGLMFGAATPLCLAAIGIIQRAESRYSVRPSQIPERYRGHFLAAMRKVDDIKEAVHRLPESAVAERLAPQTMELDQMLWHLAVAARSTEGLIRAEQAATAGDAHSLQAALGERLTLLDRKFSQQLSSLEETYRATKRIEASVVLWEPGNLELLADVEAPMVDAEISLLAVHSAVVSMRQAVAEINRTLEVEAAADAPTAAEPGPGG
jgi:hypothetical protein